MPWLLEGFFDHVKIEQRSRDNKEQGGESKKDLWWLVLPDSFPSNFEDIKHTVLKLAGEIYPKFFAKSSIRCGFPMGR